MDWTQAFVILGVFSGMFLYLLNKIDGIKNDLGKEIQSVRIDLTKEVQSLRTDLSREIQKNREEILWIKFRLDPYEHPNLKDEESPKEN